MDLARFWGVAETGEAIEVAVAPSLVGELDRRWPPLGLERRTEPATPVTARVGLSNSWVIVPDVEESGESPPPVAWDLLESTLTLFAVTRLTHLVAVHSAAIAHDGRVLVVPAVSGGGKSTLSIAAVEAGATLLSDEYTLIDPATGLVSGWRRPVRRLRDDGETDRLDITSASEPLPVGLVAAVAYDPEGSGTWRSISPGDRTSASTRSWRSGLRALAHSRWTRPGVSSPASVVRSIVWIALMSHAACHCFLTVRRVVSVAARR